MGTVEVAVRRRLLALRPRSAPPRSANTLSAITQPRPRLRVYTRVPVLDPGRGKTKTGWLWPLARDDRPRGGADPPGRGGEYAEHFLDGFDGILQVDGYAGYNRLPAAGPGNDRPAKLAARLRSAPPTIQLGGETVNALTFKLVQSTGAGHEKEAMKRQTLLVLAVVGALEFVAAAHGEAYAQNERGKLSAQVSGYLDRGAAAALAFDWIEACKWYALATAFGGTNVKDFYDGVALILSAEERKSCLENVHAESVQQREAHLKAEQMARYRTDTLNRLRQVLGDRPDVSIVGHRLVFQSEVLFATGEDEILQGGLTLLKHLATTLLDLIPHDVDCYLLVTSADDIIRRPDTKSAEALWFARIAAVTESLFEQGITRCRLTTNPFSTGELNEIALELKFTSRDPG